MYPPCSRNLTKIQGNVGGVGRVSMRPRDGEGVVGDENWPRSPFDARSAADAVGRVVAQHVRRTTISQPSSARHLARTIHA